MPTSSATSFSFTTLKHDFAAWSASRAASAFGCRFSVEAGREIIEATQLPALASGRAALPQADQADLFHRELHQSVIDSALRQGIPFTYGISAKLTSMYFKAALLDSHNCEEPCVAALHPPVDRELLLALIAAEVGDAALWRKSLKVGWTRLNREQYEAVIAGLRELLGHGTPLWMAEQYWGGYQGAAAKAHR